MVAAVIPTMGFDGSLPRLLAGAGFRRADTARDERAAPREGALERAWHQAMALFAVQRAGRGRVGRLARAVVAVADGLPSLDDVQLRECFHEAVRALGPRLAQEAVLATAMACVGEACLRRLGFRPHAVLAPTEI